jgi:hypothetical protein
MTEPVLRAQGAMASVTGDVYLAVTLPAFSPGDLIVLYSHGVAWFGGNAGRPVVPPGWYELDGSHDSVQFEQILWTRAPSDDSEFPRVLKLFAGADQATTTWYGHADSFANADFHDPGWIDPVPATNSYARHTRADLTDPITTFVMIARVEFASLGSEQFVSGWASGDARFGFNVSNRPRIAVRNTLGNLIGNTAANASIPGLATGRKVWIRGDIDIATANITYYYSYADVESFWGVFFHWTQLGTTVAGSNGGTTASLTNSDSVFAGARDATTAASDIKVYAISEVINSALTLDANFTEPLDGSWTLVGGATQRIPSPELGSSSPIEDWRVGDVFAYLFGFVLNSRQVFGDDRLIYHVWRGDSFEGHEMNPVSGPPTAKAWPDRSTTFGGVAFKNITRTLATDVSTFDLPAETSGHYAFAYFGMTIRGVATPEIPPASPQPLQIRLGCALSYGVYLTDATYDRVIDRVQWKDLSWERVLDDISTASATLPDELGGALCVARLGGLLPWAYGLKIERNDAEVWSGPITNVGRQGDNIVVSAQDILVRYRKRFVTRTSPHNHDGGDAGVMLAHIFEHAGLDADAWSLPCPEVTVGVPVSRRFLPMEFKYAWDLISELLESAVDLFVMNGTLYVWEPGAGWRYQAVYKRTLDGAYNSNYDLVYGTFTEQAWTKRPDWSIDGMSQANYVAVPSSDSGEFGYRIAAVTQSLDSQVAFGVLDMVDPNPIELPADQPPTTSNNLLKARANTLAALRAFAPAIIENGTLSEDAPVDMDNLIPGSLWKLDVYDAGYGQLLTVGRLRRVRVTAKVTNDGIDEEVSPTLEPPGWSGVADV